MATKYSQAGFKFNTTSAEIAGAVSKLIMLTNLAKKEDTLSMLATLKEKNELLTEAIKVLEAETLKVQNQILDAIREDYSSILTGVKTHRNDPKAEVKAAAAEVSKYVKPMKDIFVSKKNAQIANIKSIIKLITKCKADNLELIGIAGLFNRMVENFDLYNEKFPSNSKGRVDAKNSKTTDLSKDVVKVLQDLKRVLDYHQIKGYEEEFVKNANEVWKLARQGQLISKANRDKDKDKNKDDDEDKDKDKNKNK